LLFQGVVPKRENEGKPGGPDNVRAAQPQEGPATALVIHPPLTMHFDHASNRLDDIYSLESKCLLSLRDPDVVRATPSLAGLSFHSGRALERKKSCYRVLARFRFDFVRFLAYTSRPLQNFGCRPNSLSGFGSKSSKYSNILAASILTLLDFVSASYVLQRSHFTPLSILAAGRPEEAPWDWMRARLRSLAAG
jgi:hypothetical protein